MTYAVTGSAGFIGAHLTRKLRDQGNDVLRLDRLEGEGVGRRKVDLASDPLALGGLDGIFHLAGQPGVRSYGPVFAEYVRDNLLATQRVLEAADAGTRVVFASSSSVYGEAGSFDELVDCIPRSPYGVTKLACEHLIDCYDLDVVILRYFTVYGPGQRPDMLFHRVCEAIRSREPLELYGDGEQSRSFTYVSDAVDATILAMEEGHPGSTLDVGGGETATVNEAIRMFEAAAGADCPRVEQAEARGDVRRTEADTAPLRALGWKPRVTLEKGIARQWKASGA